MPHRFAVGSFVQNITKAAAIVVAATFIGAGAASAENPKWKITLKTSHPGAKVDVWDAVAKKSLVKDKDADKDIAVEAEATKGGGQEPDKVGAHIRWQYTHNGKCWWGQVCPTRSGVEQQLGPFLMDASKAAGSCKITEERPACGHDN